MSKQLNGDQNILVQHETGVSLKFLDECFEDFSPKKIYERAEKQSEILKKEINYSSRQNTEEDQISNSTNDEIESNNKNWNSSQQDESDCDNSQDEQIFSQKQKLNYKIWKKSDEFEDLYQQQKNFSKQKKQQQQKSNKDTGLKCVQNFCVDSQNNFKENKIERDIKNKGQLNKEQQNIFLQLNFDEKSEEVEKQNIFELQNEIKKSRFIMQQLNVDRKEFSFIGLTTCSQFQNQEIKEMFKNLKYLQYIGEDEIVDLMIESHDLWQKSPLQWYQKWGSAYFDGINDDLEIKIKQENQEKQQENQENKEQQK